MGIFSRGGFDGRAERVEQFKEEFDAQRNPRPCPYGVDPEAWQEVEQTRLDGDELISMAGELGGMILERTASKGVLELSGTQISETIIKRVKGIVRKEEAGIKDATKRMD